MKLIRFFLAGIWLLGLTLLWFGGSARAQAPGAIYLAEVDGIINPPMANYVLDVLSDAAEHDAALVIIEIDTPGGLSDSMREITQGILASPVPVAVYVSPAGARAASAGLFILISGHIAAMAPSTNTGAAHPVGLTGDVDEVSAAKAVNDAAATIRALATERGRNAEWAEEAVRESVSVSETEALDLNVIDLVARNVDDLLAQIDGQTVETAAGEVTLALADAPRHRASMSIGDQFLHIIADPNIAFILLTVGSLGIIAELYSPGTAIPGTIGAFSLLLAFFALGNLPTNWAGVAFILLALGLFVGELNTDGTGFLGVAAVAAFLLGSLILFRPLRPGSPALPTLRVAPGLIALMATGMGAFLVIVVRQVVRARGEPVRTGQERYIGQTARVRDALEPRGRVWFQGQGWSAIARDGETVPAGQWVRIVAVEGLTLIVEPIEEIDSSDGGGAASR
jgi:membrane-bound serine protease (ClpP class)